jgi:drug/metabolite transporter, DME family
MPPFPRPARFAALIMDENLAASPCEPVLFEQELPMEGRVPSVRQARILVMVASLMWSTSGFFVKAPYFVGWKGPALAFWRAVFACLILWPVVRRPRWSWAIVPMTFFFAGMNYTYLTSMVEGTAANAIWLQCTAPVWVLVVGVLVFRERAILRDWIMMALAMLGIGIIVYYEAHGIGLAAVGWGLASSFFYAGVVLSLRHLRGLDPVWLSGLNHLVTAIFLAPLALKITPIPSGIQWLFLAGFGIFQMAVPYVLFAFGLKRIAGHEATGIGLIEPLLNPLWAFLAWGDRPAWWTIVGGLFIVLGLAIRYFGPTKFKGGRVAKE